MFKNAPHVKKNVIRMQVKHLLNANSLEIVWFSFLFLNLKKLLDIKSLFYLFGRRFITLSYKLQEVNS